MTEGGPAWSSRDTAIALATVAAAAAYGGVTIAYFAAAHLGKNADACDKAADNHRTS